MMVAEMVENWAAPTVVCLDVRLVALMVALKELMLAVVLVDLMVVL